MLFTIVLWWVPAIAILVGLGCLIFDEWHDRKPDWEDYASVSTVILIVGWAVGFFIAGLLLLFSTATSGVEQKIVNSVEYKVSDTSKIEYKERYYVKFISEEPDGSLKPQQIDFHEINFENLDGKTVQVNTVDHYQPWLCNWVTNTETQVVIK